MNTSNGAPWEMGSGEFRFVTDGTCRWCDLEVHRLPRGRIAVICRDSADDPRQTVADVVDRLAAIVCRRWTIDPHALIWIERHEAEGDAFGSPVYHRVCFVVARTLRGWSFVQPTRQRLAESDLLEMGLPVLASTAAQPRGQTTFDDKLAAAQLAPAGAV